MWFFSAPTTKIFQIFLNVTCTYNCRDRDLYLVSSRAHLVSKRDQDEIEISLESHEALA